VRSKALTTIAAVAALLAGCDSGASTPRSLSPVPVGKTVVSQTRNETVRAYAESVLPQSFNSPLQGEAQGGDLAVGDVKVCVPAAAEAQPVRANDYQLLLADGKRITATTGAIHPPVPDGLVRGGSCVEGMLNWVVAPNNHPTILDRHTGAQWKPVCAKSTVSKSPCVDQSR
jgi:hypothetical protein